MPHLHDYLADYRRLGLAADCSLPELQQAWRRAVAENHPDRARQGASSEALVEVSQAYRRLRRFERRYGRLPGQTPETAARATRLDTTAARRAENALTSSPRYAVALCWGAALLGALLLLQWAASNHVPRSLEAPVRVDLPSQTLSPRAPDRVIRIGDTAADVHRVLGEPILREGDTWEYGPSHVRFERQRVVGWYSSPMAPLPVDSGSAPTATR